MTAVHCLVSWLLFILLPISTLDILPVTLLYQCNSFYEKLSYRMVIPSYFSHQISLQPLVCHDTISNHTKGPRHDSPLPTNQPTQ